MEKLLVTLKKVFMARQKKFTDDQIRLKSEDVYQLISGTFKGWIREELTEQPTALSVLRFIQKMEDEKKGIPICYQVYNYQ